MKDNLRAFTRMLDDLIDPFQIILALRPAEADVITFASSMTSRVGQKHVVTQVLMVHLGESAHLLRMPGVAMSNDDGFIRRYLGR